MNSRGHFRGSRVACLVAAILGLLSSSLSAAEPTAPLRLPLWPEKAPDGSGGWVSPENSALTVHRPTRPNGMAVVICPGGGYGGVVAGPEGHGIARWLNQHGIVGVVLEYRLPAGRSRVPLLDAQRAIRTVRLNARELQVDPKRVGIIGFSAGGHLAATASTRFDLGDPGAAHTLEGQSCRPDFTLLVYPVITFGGLTHSGSRDNLLGKNPSPEAIERFSCERQVTRQTPPAFLAHAVDDRAVVIDNSRLYHAALKAHGISSRLLELPDGGHGLHGYQGTSWDAWQREAIDWLKAR
ncbi:MAG: alpha/beta hydrolase [Verrucomicrobiota bacterium]